MNLCMEMRQSDRKMLIEACVQFYAKELKIDKSDFTLFVFSSKDIVKEQGANGMAIPIDDKVYSVFLNSRMDSEKLIEVIAHEMVHIKQYCRNELNEEAHNVLNDQQHSIIQKNVTNILNKAEENGGQLVGAQYQNIKKTSK